MKKKKNEKLMISVTDYKAELDTEYRSLKNILEDVKNLIEKYGEDAELFSGRDHWGDRESYVTSWRLETDEEFADRLKNEAKAAEDAKAKQKVDEANERALFAQLKLKYEVSPDESK